MLFKKRKKTRVCVLGLDGVPHSLLLELSRTGVMPSMAKLLETGRLHKMKASLPEISSVSWSDFMTGANSGTHGIFGFTDLKPGSYGLRFPNFLDLRTRTFWDALGDLGKTCVVINQPSTYPARKINGILVSGFVALDLGKAVFPAPLKAELERLDYLIDVDTSKIRENPSLLWSELRQTMTGRRKALEHFWNENWDYFEFVITGTDRLHHFLWDAWENKAHPDHAKFLDYYREIDRIIERISSGFRILTGGDDGLYLLSDHGFCGIKQEFYLNAWLEKEGLLKFTSPQPDGLEEISADSAAFALDPNRIYLHLKGKYPKGGVNPSESDSLKKDIRRRLEKLEHEGTKVVRRVFDAAEAYTGPLISQGPDLIVLSEYGFDVKGSVKKNTVFGRSGLQGMHTWDDAFFWASTDAGGDLKISDLAKIILGNFQ